MCGTPHRPVAECETEPGRSLGQRTLAKVRAKRNVPGFSAVTLKIVHLIVHWSQFRILAASAGAGVPSRTMYAAAERTGFTSVNSFTRSSLVILDGSERLRIHVAAAGDYLPARWEG